MQYLIHLEIHCHSGIPEDILEAINDKQRSYLMNDYDKLSVNCNHTAHDMSDMERDKDADSKDSEDDKPKTSKSSSLGYCIKS